MKVVINECFGGFGLSDEAYEELIRLGIPVRKYEEQERDEKGLWLKNKNNEGEVIFDRELTLKGESDYDEGYWEAKESGKESRIFQRYWETWIDDKRDDPRLVKVAEKLGERANGGFAELKVVEIPDGIDWEIDEYDGLETVEECHRSWS